jgi:hypothetical protein
LLVFCGASGVCIVMWYWKSEVVEERQVGAWES